MRAFLLFIALLPFECILIGQQIKEKDGLLNVFQTASHDSTKIQALCDLSRMEQDKTKSYHYITEAFAFARKGKWARGEALCYLTLGDFFARSDYARALEYRLKSLQASEALQDSAYIIHALFSIGNGYRLQENPRMALPYFFKVEEYYKRNPSKHRANNLNLIGISYEKLNKIDSALHYFNRGYEIVGEGNPLYKGRILRGLGNVHLVRGDTELALSFYRKSIAQPTAADSLVETCQTYVQLSKLFAKTGNSDSALYYARQALQIAQARNSKTLGSWAAKQLAEVYETTDAKEALRYYKLSAAIKDDLVSAESQAQIQGLTFSELERQRKIEEAKQKEAEARKLNLQYAAIALGIVCFIILFFLLSHTVMANPKLIRFFGVLALLIFFEFLNLLLHPYVGELTHHSPVLMLLIMVCVAAILIPLHHKLEHWIVHKLVEKNNRIRLAAAKRTIEQLEEKGNPEKPAFTTDA